MRVMLRLSESEISDIHATCATAYVFVPGVFATERIFLSSR